MSKYSYRIEGMIFHTNMGVGCNEMLAMASLTAYCSEIIAHPVFSQDCIKILNTPIIIFMLNKLILTVKYFNDLVSFPSVEK